MRYVYESDYGSSGWKWEGKDKKDWIKFVYDNPPTGYHVSSDDAQFGWGMMDPGCAGTVAREVVSGSCKAQSFKACTSKGDMNDCKSINMAGGKKVSFDLDWHNYSPFFWKYGDGAAGGKNEFGGNDEYFNWCKAKGFGWGIGKCHRNQHVVGLV